MHARAGCIDIMVASYLVSVLCHEFLHPSLPDGLQGCIISLYASPQLSICGLLTSHTCHAYSRALVRACLQIKIVRRSTIVRHGLSCSGTCQSPADSQVICLDADDPLDDLPDPALIYSTGTCPAASSSVHAARLRPEVHCGRPHEKQGQHALLGDVEHTQHISPITTLIGGASH